VDAALHLAEFSLSFRLNKNPKCGVIIFWAEPRNDLGSDQKELAAA